MGTDRPNRSGIDVVDVPVDSATVRQELATSDDFDGAGNGLVQVLESAHVHAGSVPALRADRLGKLRLAPPEQTTLRMPEDEDLSRTQDGLRECERAQHVRCRQRTRIAENVRISRTETEQRNGVDACIHAGEDHGLKPGRRGQRTIRLAGSRSSVPDQAVDRAHRLDASLRPSRWRYLRADREARAYFGAAR